MRPFLLLALFLSTSANAQFSIALGPIEQTNQSDVGVVVATITNRGPVAATTIVHAVLTGADLLAPEPSPLWTCSFTGTAAAVDCRSTQLVPNVPVELKLYIKPAVERRVVVRVSNPNDSVVQAGVFYRRVPVTNTNDDIYENRIGTNRDGGPLPNGASGIFFDAGTYGSDVRLNRIAYNRQFGVSMARAAAHLVLDENSIAHNGLTAIDRGLDGIDPFSALVFDDFDTRDAKIPPPRILSATYDPAANTTTIDGLYFGEIDRWGMWRVTPCRAISAGSTSARLATGFSTRAGRALSTGRANSRKSTR